MKEQMGMLQVLDMSGVTELPKMGGAWADLRYIPANSFQNKLTLRKSGISGSTSNYRAGGLL